MIHGMIPANEVGAMISDGLPLSTVKPKISVTGKTYQFKCGAVLLSSLHGHHEEALSLRHLSVGFYMHQ